MAARACAVFVCGLGVQLGCAAGQSGFLADMEHVPFGESPVVKDAVVTVQQNDNPPDNALPPVEMWVMVGAGFLMAWACSIFCLCPSQQRPQSQDVSGASEKGPSVLPRVLWINGCRGWIAYWLTAPLFLILFALMAIPWIPIVLINLVYRVLTCQGFSLGRDVFNLLFPVAEVFLGLMFAKNPLCPRGIVANIGKWYGTVLAILAGLIGRLIDCLRKRKAKADGGAGDLPAPDPWVKETKVSERITYVEAGFKEVIDLPAEMTVIRHSNYVIFMNPVFAPVDVYKKHGEGAERVILFLPTCFHHMAADLCLAAFPNAEIWGCQEAGTRHVPNLAVKDPNTAALNCAGVRTASLAGTCYDERWLFFEPEGHLCVGDYMPGVTENMDVPPCLEAIALAMTCGGKQYMLSYQRTFVTNHSEVIAELEKVLSWDLRGLSGCHSSDLGGSPVMKLINYWGWLLPGGYSYQPREEGAVQLTGAGS